MPNIDDLEPLELRDQPGFRARRSRLGWSLGAERLGLSVWEIEPGEAAYPYHYHLTEEEVVIVLAGTPSVRTGSGWTQLAEGDAVRFGTGEQGGHQVANWGTTTARFLAISTNGTSDVVIYPESDKVGVFERLVGRRGLSQLFRREDAVEYHHGETPPQRPG
jgi:uncharacterized cupin superfamily protein